MLDTRVDGLPENQLAETIKDLTAQAEEIKNRQFASGAYNVVSYLNQNGSGWDYTATLGSIGDPSGYPHTLTMLFDADNQSYPMARPYMDIFIDGTTESNRLQPSSPHYIGVNGEAVLDFYVEPNSQGLYLDNSDGQLEWYSTFTVFGQVTVYIKVYTRSTDTGTLQVTKS